MKVVVTDRRFPESDPYSGAVEAVSGTVEYGEYETLDEIVEGCRDADVVVTFHAPITREVIENMDRAKLILRNGAGFDDVNIKAANEYGIPVSSMRGYANEEMAEHAITLMLAASRDVVFSDRDVRTAAGWGERRNVNAMAGGTFGIVGLGEIGRQAAQYAQGLDMDVVASDPYVSRDVFCAMDVKRVPFEEVLNRSDCVSLHCQLTAETRHLMSTAEFERMRENAVLVNVSRGGLVDEPALVDAVESGSIYAAGVDVFESEPPTNSPLFDCDQIVCSPHHGGQTADVEERCIQMGREEIVRALTGEQLQMVINPEAIMYDDTVGTPDLENWT